MPDFVNNYLPPGVYIEEDVTPLVTVVGTSPSVVAILGPSVGYRTHTEAVELTGTAPVMLEKLGINSSSGFEARRADGTLITGSDYALVVGAGADADVGETEDNTLTIARTSGSGITNGGTVWVTYRYTDADYTMAHRFRDFDDVKDFYGQPLDTTTGDITSPVSLAAQVVFQNGAREIVIVATTGSATSTTRNELNAAYDKLATLFDVNIVIPLPVGITGTALAPGDVINVGSDFKTRIDASADDDGTFRIGIIGYESDVTVLPVTIAAGIDSRRVILAWPNGVNYFDGFNNTTFEVGGYYLAAAMGGLLASQRVQDPLTRKQVRGFAGIPGGKAVLMTVANKNTWSQGGVAVAEIDRNGSLIIRHGTTTDPTSVMTREVSVVRGKDAMVQLIHTTIERSGLIGSPLDPESPLRIKGVISGCLETLVGSGVINGYINLKVRQQSADPTVIEVKYQYSPSYPLNYITVSFSVDTLTGATTLAA